MKSGGIRPETLLKRPVHRLALILGIGPKNVVHKLLYNNVRKAGKLSMSKLIAAWDTHQIEPALNDTHRKALLSDEPLAPPGSARAPNEAAGGSRIRLGLIELTRGKKIIAAEFKAGMRDDISEAESCIYEAFRHLRGRG